MRDSAPCGEAGALSRISPAPARPYTKNLPAAGDNFYFMCGKGTLWPLSKEIIPTLPPGLPLSAARHGA
jgi:hypothetical protein